MTTASASLLSCRSIWLAALHASSDDTMESVMAQDILVDLGDTVLERGDTLRGDVAHARMYGQEGAPIIVVLGGISATRFVRTAGVTIAVGGQHSYETAGRLISPNFKF